MKPSEFRLSPEEMRASGYEAVNLVVEFLESLPAMSAFETGTPEEMQRLIGEIPEQGRPIVEVLRHASREIMRYRARPSHPRFFAFVPGVGNYAGALADFLAHGHNVFAGSWMEASGPAMVEILLLNWLRDVIGYPEEAGGVLVSGGSMANLTALAVARDSILGEDGLSQGVAYLSDQTHSSVDRALRLIGIPNRRIRKIPSDPDYRIPVDALRAAIENDLAAGLRPFCIIGNAGTTNTGAVDPLASLARIAELHNIWLHVDGSYGAAAALCAEGKQALEGIEQAGSIALDPHKWFFQPFDCGCVLLRKGSLLPRTFHMRPEYLEDVGGSGEVNFWDYGPELTRSFRALKLWVSLQVFGIAGCREAIEHGFHLARVAENHVRALPDWEVCTEAQMGIVTFRFAPPGILPERLSGINREIGLRFSHSGQGFIVSTTIKGQTVLRMCTINPRSSEEDVRQSLDALQEIAGRL